jgi:hypothetical protein
VSGCGNCRKLNAQIKKLKRWMKKSDDTLFALRNDVTSHTLTLLKIANQVMSDANQATTIPNQATTIRGLRSDISALQMDVNYLFGDVSLIALREVCYSLEENICHDLFGATAVEDHSYRFSTLKNKPERLQKCEEIVESMGLDMCILKTLKSSGNTLVHRTCTPFFVEELQRLIIPRIGSRSASAFMEALEKYRFIDVAGKVDTFRSPFPNRRDR